MGIVASGVRNEAEPVLALLSEMLDTGGSNAKKPHSVRAASVCGLAIAYAGTKVRGAMKKLTFCVCVVTWWCGVTWCCGVVWCGVVWCGVVLPTVWCSVV